MIRMNKKKTINMKTRALVGITVSLLLLALPVAASECTLGIFGNANEDDTINMQDVTYTELIILEYRDKTELSDAKYDGRINMQDVTQIELVILGRELELWYTNRLGEPRSVSKPVERIIPMYYAHADAVRILGARDRVVGIAHMYDVMTEHGAVYYPYLSKLPYVGGYGSMDIEAIIDLEPDAVIGSGRGLDVYLEDKLEGTDIDVVGLESVSQGNMFDVMKLGYIIDEEENAREFLEWHDACVDMIEGRVSEIPEDEKQRVFWIGGTHHIGKSSVGTWAGGVRDLSEMVGVINIVTAAGMTFDGSPLVEWEWVLGQNPDAVICHGGVGEGYSADDVVAKALHDTIMEMPGIENIAAGQNNRVLLMNMLVRGPGYVVSVPYMAKWLYPESFEDLDPQEIHQEYVDRFLRIDFDVRERGVFIYPPIEI